MKKVFINGCFDILHPGHISLIAYARSCGDSLLVAIDSDSRIRESKGSGRPFYGFKDRSFFLNNIKGVDEVLVFETDEELVDIIKDYSPDIMIVGDDWRGKKIIGSAYAKEVRFFKRIGGYSTTKIIEGSSCR